MHASDPQPPPPPPPKRKRSCLRTGAGCLAILVVFLLGGVALIRILIWGTPFPDHSERLATALAAREPGVPTVDNTEELPELLLRSEGDLFKAYVRVEGMDGEVLLTVEKAEDGDFAGQAAAFETFARDYARHKPDILRALLRQYRKDATNFNSLPPPPEKGVMNIVLRVAGFPAIDNMHPVINTPEEMERHWGTPWVEIAPDAVDGVFDVVVQNFPSWNPEDTFGVVLRGERVVYVGMDPDVNRPGVAGYGW